MFWWLGKSAYSAAAVVATQLAFKKLASTPSSIKMAAIRLF